MTESGAPVETPVATSPVFHPAAPRGPGMLALALMMLLLAAISGGVGGLAVLHFRPAQTGPHIAVLDTTKITEAIADATKRDEGIVQRFPQRFDQIIRQLQEADPDRVILLREAVVGSDVDDLTPMVLQEILGQTPPASRRSNGR